MLVLALVDVVKVMRERGAVEERETGSNQQHIVYEVHEAEGLQAR